MTLEAKIIRYLKAGQATTSAMADALRVSEPAVDSVMQRLLREERVSTRVLGGLLSVVAWRLKEGGEG
jgi:predicted ArsR family transcriptional regulator